MHAVKAINIITATEPAKGEHEDERQSKRVEKRGGPGL